MATWAVQVLRAQTQRDIEHKTTMRQQKQEAWHLPVGSQRHDKQGREERPRGETVRWVSVTRVPYYAHVRDTRTDPGQGAERGERRGEGGNGREEGKRGGGEREGKGIEGRAEPAGCGGLQPGSQQCRPGAPGRSPSFDGAQSPTWERVPRTRSFLCARRVGVTTPAVSPKPQEGYSAPLGNDMLLTLLSPSSAICVFLLDRSARVAAGGLACEAGS